MDRRPLLLQREVQDNQPAIVALEYFHGAANFDPRLHVRSTPIRGLRPGDRAPDAAAAAHARRARRPRRAEVGRSGCRLSGTDGRASLVSHARPVGPSFPAHALASTIIGAADLMAGYVSVSEGAKNGGFNGRAGTLAEFNRYEPEKVWTGELGLRSQWYGHRLRLRRHRLLQHL